MSLSGWIQFPQHESLQTGHIVVQVAERQKVKHISELYCAQVKVPIHRTVNVVMDELDVVLNTLSSYGVSGRNGTLMGSTSHLISRHNIQKVNKIKI